MSLPAPSQIWSFEGHTNTVNAVAVDADGYIYTAGKDGSVRKISPSGSQVWSFTGHSGAVNDVAVDTDGYVYSGGADYIVRKINPNGTQVWSFTGHTFRVMGVAVDSSGNVYSGSADNTLRKISPTGSQIWSFTGHTNTIYGVAVDSSGDVYTASADNTIRKVWSGGTQAWSYNHGSPVNGVAVASDGSVYGAANNWVLIKVRTSGSLVWTASGYTGALRGVAVGPGGYVYTASNDQTVRKTSSSGEEIWSYTGHTDRVYAVAVDSDGYVYSGSGDQTVRKLDRVNNRLSATNQINYGISRTGQAPLVVRVGEPGQGTAGMTVHTGRRGIHKAPLGLSYGLIRKEEVPLVVKVGTPRQGSAGMIVRAGIKRLRQALLRVEVLKGLASSRRIHAKMIVFRPDNTPVDVTDYLASVDIELGSIEDIGTGTGTDIGVRSIDFVLKNDGANVHFWPTEGILGDSEDALGSSSDVLDDGLSLLGDPEWGRDSFAPRDKTSSWNQHGGRWTPLLWPYRGVRFEAVATAPGVRPGPHDPRLWFEGYLGDNITTDSHSVAVTCRDKSKALQDAYIDVPKTYEGPISPENLIQAIINDYVDSPPTLYVPVATGMTFESMTVEYVSVWDAIQNVAKQIGWFLGYRWNGTSFALTFMDPPRHKDAADFALDWKDEIYQETLDIGDSEIRNALTLTFRDKDTKQRVTLRHTDYEQLRNQESIDEYRRRVMQIEEADTSLIDTEAKALAFGEKCIWDLSELSATDRLNLPLLPELDLFSTFTVTNPLISSTTDFYSVQSIRHSLKFGENARFRTEVIATGRVVGARSKWLDMETRPGRPGKPIDPGRMPPGSLPPDRVPNYSLGVDKFMEDVKPVRLVSTTPTLPHPDFPAGTHIYPIDTKKLLITPDGLTWDNVGATDFSELSGQITETQIEPGAIQTPHLAANAVHAANLYVDETITNKIVAGIGQFGGISTEIVTIKSTDGRTTISGNTMVVKDDAGRTRVRIGRLS